MLEQQFRSPPATKASARRETGLPAGSHAASIGWWRKAASLAMAILSVLLIALAMQPVGGGDPLEITANQARSIARLLDRETAAVRSALGIVLSGRAVAQADTQALLEEMRVAGRLGGSDIVLEADGVGLAPPPLAVRRAAPKQPYAGVRPGGDGAKTFVHGPDALVSVPVKTAGLRGRLDALASQAALEAVASALSLSEGSVVSLYDDNRREIARVEMDGAPQARRGMDDVIAERNARLADRREHAWIDGRRLVAVAPAPESGVVVLVSAPQKVPGFLPRHGLLGAALCLVLSSLAAGGWQCRRGGSMWRDAVPGRGRVAAARPQDDRTGACHDAARAKNGLRALFDKGPVGVAQVDAGGRVREANDAYLDILGVTRDDMEAGRVRWDELTPPEWLGRDKCAIAEAQRQGACTPYQKAYLRPDGRLVPVLVFFAFDNPALGTAAAFIVDLSGWAGTDLALANAHEYLRLAAEAAQIHPFEWDLITNQVRLSKSLERDLRMAPGSFAGNAEAFHALVHPADFPDLRRAFQKSIIDGAPYEAEFRVRRADGTWRWTQVRASVFHDGTGKARRIVGIDKDITRRKLAELAVSRQRDELATVYETAPVGLCLIDQDLRCVRHNARFFHELGVAPAAASGCLLREVAPGFAELAASLARDVLHSGVSARGVEITARLPESGGRARTWQVDMHRIGDGAGEVWAVSIAVRDVTDAQELARRLEFAQLVLGEEFVLLDQAAERAGGMGATAVSRCASRIAD